MRESTWAGVLRDLPELSEDTYVCFAKLPITEAHFVLLVEEAEWQSDDEDVPAPASKAGLGMCLSKGEVEQTIWNASQQVTHLSPSMICAALSYYVEHDGFITLARPD